MSHEDLKQLCWDNGISNPTETREDLLDYLLKEFGA